MKRFDSIQVSNIFRGALMLAVLLVPSAVQAQVNWQAIVGTQSSDKGRQAMAFLPNELWIHAGESITWTSHTDESHTVTFLTPGQIRPRNTPPPPASAGCPGTTASGSDYTGTDGTACVHSGSFVSPATYTVNFPTAGNYKLVCLIHASMTGVVHVLGMSETLPHNQAFYDDQAVDEGRDLLSDRDHDGHDWDDDRGDWRSPRNAVTAGIGEVVATGGGTSYLAVMRFLKGTIKVHVGDTVEWTNLDPAEPHTITFGTEPANPRPQSSWPRRNCGYRWGPARDNKFAWRQCALGVHCCSASGADWARSGNSRVAAAARGRADRYSLPGNLYGSGNLQLHLCSS